MIYLGLVDGQEIPEGYDKYVWMSERCLEGAAWCENKGIEFQCISKNWKTNEEILSCMNYLNEVKKVVMDYAVDILNKYHGTRYTREAWNIVLSQWLNVYLFSLYDKYLKIKKVENMGENCECYLHDIEKIIPALDYYDQWTMLCETDEYHVYQYSQLYDFIKPLEKIKVCNTKEFHRPAVKRQEKSLGYWKVKVYRKLISMIKFLTRKEDRVVVQNSYLPDTLLLRVMGKGKGEITNYIIDYYRYERTELEQRIDISWRSQEYDFGKFDNEFTELVCKMLKRNIPIAYVEDFRFLQKRAKKVYKYGMNPKAVVFANGATYNDELFKAYLLNLKSKNTTFCGIQHGGNYGIDYHLTLESEYEMCDIFYTWGWKKNGNQFCKFKPMPLVKLVNRSFHETTEKSDILYVSYTFTKNIGRLDKNELMYDENLNYEKLFLFSLDSNLKSQMRIRLYMHDYGWNVRKDLEKDPELQFDTIPDFYESLDKAKLVILAEWSTTIVEALCANKPILVRRDSWCIEEKACDDLMDLERVGILVHSFGELDQQIRKILPNLDEWWNDIERQKVIKKICDKYAYMPANADELWLKELMSLAE